MIESLTPEQEAAKNVYRDKWIKFGLSTEPCDPEVVAKLFPAIYEQAKLPVPSTVLWVDSPRAAVTLLHEQYGIEPRDSQYHFCYGQHDAAWLGFYDYSREVLGLTEATDPIVPTIALAEKTHWYAPYDEVIVFVHRPTEIHLKHGETRVAINSTTPDEVILNGKLHHDGGAAILYRDGEAIYALNGIRIPEELKHIAITNSNELDPSELLRIKNAEIRREFVRKVGMERIIEQCGVKTIDTETRDGHQYDLMLFNIAPEGEDENWRPYLKMTNPSIGVYHVEGVPPNVTTVAGAIAFRNGSDEIPTVLT